MRRRDSFAIVLVGKCILFREGLARILRSANFRIRASVSSADDLLQSKLQLHRPFFLIVHTGKDFDAAVGQIKLFRDQHPDGRVAIVAGHYRLDELVSAFRAGANGYFVDVTTCDVFVKSMELVTMGETIFPPTFLSFVQKAEGNHLSEAVPRDENNAAILTTTEDTIAPQLSAREKSILRYLIEGDSNKGIARKIDITEATVKVHVKAILRKIRVQNRTQAAIWGMNNGSLTRTVNPSSVLPTCDLSKRLPKPVGEIPEIKQVEAAGPLGVIDHEAIWLPASGADCLIRKLKAEGGTRLRK
jgi:DNA-binding NarL/FixJ family response regulator